MTYVPSVFYAKKISTAVEDYISDGFYSFDSLRDDDKDGLVAICLDVLGSDAHESIVESENLNQTIHHLKMFLKTRKKEFALDLAETMAKNCVDYFTPILIQLFNDANEQHHQLMENYIDYRIAHLSSLEEMKSANL